MRTRLRFLPGATPSERNVLTLSHPENARNQRGEGEVFGQPIIANITGNKDHGLDTQDGAKGPVFEAGQCGVR